MSTIPEKSLSLIRFWGAFGVLIIALVAGMMGFNTKVAKIEQRQDTFTQEIIRADGERHELDQAQRQIMLQLESIKNNQLHQNELLQEIKHSIK